MADKELGILIRAKGAAQASAAVKGVDASFAGLTNRAGTFATNLRSNVSGAVNHFGGRVRSLVTGPLGMLTGAAGLFGVEQAFSASIHSATSFAAAMELVHTQAGGTQAEVDQMSKSLLHLAASVGTTPEELAAGLYHVESAGYRGAKALDILTIAAEGAKVGNADLESVTNALVGAEQSGVKGATDITQAMGTLNAIVGAGNMRMQDLADSMASGILASAKTFGVSLQSVGAALATMTDEGIPAIDAATRLRMSMNLLGAPTSHAAAQLKNIGIGQLDLAKAMRSPGGITAAMELLRSKMTKAGLIDASGNINAGGAQLLSKAFGGGRSSSAIMTLVGNLSLLKSKTDAVNKGAGSFGEAWAATQKTSKMAFDKFGAALQTLEITIGAKILPSVTDFLGTLTTAMTDNADAIAAGVGGALEFAKMAAGTIAGLARTALGFWNTIPAPLRDMLVTGIVADRTVKFLFGFSPVGSIAGALTGGLANALGKGLAQAGIGKLFVQPVFVTNMGAGGLGGGGVPGGVAGKGGGGGLGILGALGIAAIVDTVATEVVGPAVRDWALSHNLAGSGDNAGKTDSQLAREHADAASGRTSGAAAPSGIVNVVDNSPGARDERAAARRSAIANAATAAHTEALNSGLNSKQQRAIAKLEAIRAAATKQANKREDNRINLTVRNTATTIVRIAAREVNAAQTTFRVYHSGGGGKFQY